MKGTGTPLNNGFLKGRKWHGFIRRAIAVLSAFVMLFTMNTLKRTANTLERIPMCHLAEHVHSDGCYDGDGNLVCGMDEHVHTDACYQEQPTHEDVPEELEVDLGSVTEDDGTESGDGAVEEQPEQDLPQDVPEEEPEFRLEGPVLLSEIIDQLHMKVNLRKVQDVGAVENDAAHAGLVLVERLDGDYRVSPLRPFDDTELAIVLKDDILLVRLIYAVQDDKPAGTSDDEPEEVSAGEQVGASDEQTSDETENQTEVASDDEASDAAVQATMDETVEAASDEKTDETADGMANVGDDDTADQAESDAENQTEVASVDETTNETVDATAGETSDETTDEPADEAEDQTKVDSDDATENATGDESQAESEEQTEVDSTEQAGDEAVDDNTDNEAADNADADATDETADGEATNDNDGETADDEATDENGDETEDEAVEENEDGDVEDVTDEADEDEEADGEGEDETAEPTVEEQNYSASVTVDLSGVDLMDAATIEGATVTLSVADLLEGKDDAVSVEGDLDVDSADFVNNAEVTSSDVLIEDGTITLSADALEQGTVSLQLQTETTEGDVTTITTQTVDIELNGYAGRTMDEIDSDPGVQVVPVDGNSLPADAYATISDGEVPQALLSAPTEGVVESAAAYDITVRIDNENQDELSNTGDVAVTVTPVDLNVLEGVPEGATVENITCKLYHIHDDGTREIVKGVAFDVSEDGTVNSFTFNTDGFSTYVIVYTVDFGYVDLEGTVNLDFTGFDALSVPEDASIVYDSTECDVHVNLGWLRDIIQGMSEPVEENGELIEDAVAYSARFSRGFDFDISAAALVSAEDGVDFVDGELILSGDGVVNLTDGNASLRINVRGLSALKEELLETTGVSIEVVEGNVPLGSEASYEAHTEAETMALVNEFITADEPVETTGYAAADLKIVRDGEALPVEGQFRVTVDRESLVPAGMKLEKLYHIHDDLVEELAVEESEAGLTFEMTGFSDIVASYTVDFAYFDGDGVLHAWQFPGNGSYRIIDVLAALDIEAQAVLAADLGLTEVVGEEEGNAALYLDRDEDGNLTINSDMAFDDVYQLVVIADDTRYEITVTDDQTWTVNINLYSYTGTSAATTDEMSVLSGKSYGVVALLKNKQTGEIVGYNKTSTGATFSSNSSATVQIDCQSFRPLSYSNNSWQEDYNNPITLNLSTYSVEFRLYEDSCAASDWQHKGYGSIINLPDSMNGFEFLSGNGNVVDAANTTTTFNLKRAYAKQYNVRLNMEPAGLTITAADQYYAFITVDHQTTGTTYAYQQITVAANQQTVDLHIDEWYDNNGTKLTNEKFTGNETVTVQIYTTNMKEDGTKDGFADINAIKNSQVKVLVAEGSSINRYNLYYGARTSESDDTRHITNYYDNLYLRAPNGNISKGDIDRLLDDATDFGYYTLRYVGHSGDIEATIAADFMDTNFLADFGYSSANVNVNRLKVLKIYTDDKGDPVPNEEVTVVLYKINDVDHTQTKVDQKTGTTDANGRLELEFEGLNSGNYAIEEIIGDEVVHGNGSANVEGETIYYNFSIDKAHFANNLNVNYFGTIGPNQDLDKLKTMLQKASRVDVVIITDTQADKERIDAAKEAQTTGKRIDVVLNGDTNYPYKKYDLKSDFVKLKQLSDDLASAQSSNTVRIVNMKASEISENGLFFDDDGRYIVINIEMDQDTFCPMVHLGGQLLDCDYGQSGKSNSSHVLYNLRKNGTYYGGDVNTSKLGAGVILAPAANAHVLGGPFGGTIITDRVNRAGNELHSNNPNQIQTLNATIQNVKGVPTTGSLELRKLFANSSIKDKITYFTFKVKLSNTANQSLVQDKDFPASGLKRGLGDTVHFDENGEAEVLVRADNSVTITNLPAGTTYTVTELTTPETEHFNLDHYDGNTGTIVAGATQSAKVYNTIDKADLTIEKQVAGTTDADKEFEFTLVLENKTSEEGQPEVWVSYPDKYKISVAGGEYTEVDGSQNPSYTFRLKAGQKAELQDLVVDGRVIRYSVTETAVYVDGTRYPITPDNQPVKGYSNSDLVVQANYTQGDRVVFVNKYSANTKVRLVGNKVMLGRDLTEEEFNFELREDSPTGSVIATGTNAADGTITFADIEYKIEHRANQPITDCMAGATIKLDGSREKVFTYYICEVIPENPDPTIAYAEPVEVKVKVVDDGRGNLRAYDEAGNLITVYSDAGVLTSYTYTLPAAKHVVNTLKAEQTLHGTKVMTGRDMAAGETFTFIVTERVDGNDVVVATGTATGPSSKDNPVNIAFTPIAYRYDPAQTYPLTHTYTITEDNTGFSADLKPNTQAFEARVTLNYDAQNKTFTAAAPEYKDGDGNWVATPTDAFINTGHKIGFTVTKEWLDSEEHQVSADRWIIFEVRKDDAHFAVTANYLTETANSVEIVSVDGVDGYVKLYGNAGDTAGWPTAAIHDVPAASYTVAEVDHSPVLDDNAAFDGTQYKLNAGNYGDEAPTVTADADAVTIKNTETPDEDRVDLTLKKVWDETQFTSDADKKTVTYDVYRVAGSGGSSGSNTVTVRLCDSWGGTDELSSTVVTYSDSDEYVSVIVSSSAVMNFTVADRYGNNISESTTTGSVTVTIPKNGQHGFLNNNPFVLNGVGGPGTQATISPAGGSTPLIEEHLTATPITHEAVVALGGTLYRTVTLNQSEWGGKTISVEKGYSYYVVERDGDKYEATYTQEGGDTLVVTNHKTQVPLKDFNFYKAWTNGVGGSITWPENVPSITVRVTRRQTGSSDEDESFRLDYTVYPDTNNDADKAIVLLDSTDLPEGESAPTAGKIDDSSYHYLLTGLKKYAHDDVEWEYLVRETSDISGFYVTYPAASGAGAAKNGETISNNRIAARLPATGGVGTGVLYAAGIGLLLLAVVGWVLRARRRDHDA